MTKTCLLGLTRSRDGYGQLYFTPVQSYYRLVPKSEDDPEFDKNKALKKLHKFVQSNSHSIQEKTEIMVDHFHEQVINHAKVGGKARAMVVTSGIQNAIQYYRAIAQYLEDRKSPYKAIVAFSGEHDYGGKKVSESTFASWACL